MTEVKTIDLSDPSMVGNSTEDDWKMITISIGSKHIFTILKENQLKLYFPGNDICRSCGDEFKNATTSDLYAEHLEVAIKRIQSEVPKVLVNICKLK